ncbi:MAG: hypothetical protein AB7F94_05165 [Nitrospira sp.]
MTQTGWEIRPLGWVLGIVLLLIGSILIAGWVRRWPGRPELNQ